MLVFRRCLSPLFPTSSRIVYSIQFLYYLCNRILQTLVGVSSPKEKKVRQNFLKKDPAPLNLYLPFSSKIPVGNSIIRKIPPSRTRPISVAFSHQPSQETKRCNSSCG